MRSASAWSAIGTPHADLVARAGPGAWNHEGRISLRLELLTRAIGVLAVTVNAPTCTNEARRRGSLGPRAAGVGRGLAARLWLRAARLGAGGRGVGAAAASAAAACGAAWRDPRAEHGGCRQASPARRASVPAARRDSSGRPASVSVGGGIVAGTVPRSPVVGDALVGAPRRARRGRLRRRAGRSPRRRPTDDMNTNTSCLPLSWIS